VRLLGVALAALGLACFARGFWTLVHGGTVLQFVLLECAALVLVAGGGWFWELGRK
jgi:hypothetical protein